MHLSIRFLPLTVFALILAACAGLPQADPARSEALAKSAADAATSHGYEPAEPVSLRRRSDTAEAAIDAALESPTRLPIDASSDVLRKPDAVLKFFGIRPGMTVLDLYSGGGYYTEILSALVGPKGRVVAHNNAPILAMDKKELDARYAPGRLTNVERLTAENNALVLPRKRFDAVLISMAYHDIYYVNEKSGWQRIDGPKLLAELYKGMKPGAVLGIIDHVAAPGAPPETGGTLHRIDPELLKREITAAGFRLEAESDVLRNPADDHTKIVFDPSIRGRTDKVVLRFRKPR